MKLVEGTGYFGGMSHSSAKILCAKKEFRYSRYGIVAIMFTAGQGGKEHIVVVGFGWVGQANALALKKLGFNVSYFDPATPARHYPEHTDIYERIERLTDVRQKDSSDTW